MVASAVFSNGVISAQLDAFGVASDLDPVCKDLHGVYGNGAIGRLSCAAKEALEESMKVPRHRDPRNIADMNAFLGQIESEMCDAWYVYFPDWELKGCELVAKKGTWVKRTTEFSWEIQGSKNSQMHVDPEGEVLHYIPSGVKLPIIKLSHVSDPVERCRHQYGALHRRIWLKPCVVANLQDRRNTFFIYWPHWMDISTVSDKYSGSSKECMYQIKAKQKTYLKRNTGLSWDLNPWELILIPPSFVISLRSEVALVDEDFEKSRHAHVHEHRMVRLLCPLSVVRGEKCCILVKADNIDRKFDYNNAKAPHAVIANKN